MIKSVRGFFILAGSMLVFFLLTACASDSVFAKKEKVNPKAGAYNSASEKEEYTYDEESLNESDMQKSRVSSNAKSGAAVREDNNYNAREDDRSEIENFYQKGYASWYGREFHGRKTASGEKYDMNKLTAAHKTLPFGTKILVKNLENDNTISVTVNDRGPYRDNRILDLSYAAAKKLGIVASGEAKVGIKIVKNGKEERLANKQNNDKSDISPVAGLKDEEDNSDESVEDSHNKGSYSIQAGAFYSRKNAEKLQKRIEGLVDNPVVLTKDNEFYKVKIDSLASKKDANKVKRMLETEEIRSYVIEKQK
jgi:rare lipoprotein A